MDNIYEIPKLIPDEIIQRAKKLNSTLLADAMDGTGSMNINIKPVKKEMQVVGTATTVNMKPADNLSLHKAIYSGQSGYIIVADGKSQTSHAYLGGLMARAAKVIGLEGIIIDGAVRDRLELEKLDFPIFSLGYVPNGPYKSNPGYLNNKITCGGIVVNPGDLVFGDADGVTVVPRKLLSDVLEKAEKKLAYEKERIFTIDNYEKRKKEGKEHLSIQPDWLK